MQNQKSIRLTLFSALSVAVAIVIGCSAQAKAEQHATRIAFIKNCKLVEQRAMTAEELKLYQQIAAVEQQMHELQIPVHAFEAEMEQHSQQMTELTDLIQQEDDETIRIDKSRMAEQQEGYFCPSPKIVKSATD
jgi:septal ring factor EnvC (AmiA/AmiB activator)